MDEKRNDEELATAEELGGEAELSEQAVEAAAGGLFITNSLPGTDGGRAPFS